MPMPRGDLPFIERRTSGQVRYKRNVPGDLQPILGLMWYFNFAPGTPEETIRASAEALTKHYDDVIAERRARLATLPRTTTRF